MTENKLRIECRPIGLESLDRMSVDVLVLTPFVNDRPLRGASGYCDWRLNGRLSRLIQDEHFTGKTREVLLTNTLGRIGTPRVLLFGQGDRISLDQTTFERRMRLILETLRNARFDSFAIELPGTDPGPLSVPQAISAFVEAAATEHPKARVTLMTPYPRFAELVGEIVSDDKRVELSPKS